MELISARGRLMAIVVNKNQFKVIGEGAVTVIDAGAMTYTDVPYVGEGESIALADVKLHVLRDGHKFDLKNRQMIIPNHARTKAKRASINNGGKTLKK